MNFFCKGLFGRNGLTFCMLAGSLFGTALFLSCASLPENNSTNLSSQSGKQALKEAEKRSSEERWQRELERRKKLEAERRRKKERLALLKKQEEERRRAESAAQKKRQEELERERQRKAEEARRAEEKRKAEEARRRKRKRIARKIKELYDGDSFWAKDAALLVQGHILAEAEGKGEAALYQNPLRLQLQGLSYTSRRYTLKLGGRIPIKKGQFDLTPLLLAKQGNFLLLHGNSAFFYKHPVAHRSMLFRIRLKGRDWSLLNIYSDGEDLLRLDLESADERRSYLRLIVQELLLSP